MQARPSVKPMPAWLSIAFFGMPGAIGAWNAYRGIPLVVDLGVPLLVSFPIMLSGMGVVLLGVSLVAYRLEGNEPSWAALRDRFRLFPIRGKEWLWVCGALGLCVTSDALLEGVGKWLASFPALAPPAYFPPPFNPTVELVFPVAEFLGAPFRGNWFILWLWVPLSLVSMVGEEFWWRGYILPRQELSQGRWAWVLNGLLWALVFHVGMKWSLVGLIPSSLITVWIAQRFQNTTTSIVVHAGGNAVLFWGFLLAGVLGAGG